MANTRLNIRIIYVQITVFWIFVMDKIQDKLRGKARADELGWGILIVETGSIIAKFREVDCGQIFVNCVFLWKKMDVWREEQRSVWVADKRGWVRLWTEGLLATTLMPDNAEERRVGVGTGMLCCETGYNKWGSAESKFLLSVVRCRVDRCHVMLAWGDAEYPEWGMRKLALIRTWTFSVPNTFFYQIFFLSQIPCWPF